MRVVRQQAEKRSRLNVLEQLQDSHEGFSAGALAALKQSKSVLGSLADKIRVPDEYVAAVESALGHHLQLVLTEQPESAQEILSDLSAQQKGPRQHRRAWLCSTGVPASDLLAQSNGCRCWQAVLALSVIEADDSIHPLIAALLGQTLIVPDLATATTAWRETNGAFDFVTRTGELLNRHGIYTGGSANGSSNGKAPSSILGRKNQIAELQTQLAALAGTGQRNQPRAKARCKASKRNCKPACSRRRPNCARRKSPLPRTQGEFKALQNSQRVLHQKIDTVVYEIQSLAAQEQEGNEKRAALAAQVERHVKSASRNCQAAGHAARAAGLDELAPAARRRQHRT